MDETAILEVKCPYSIRDELVACGITNASFFLCLECENLVSKKNHRYWHQVLGQLHLTGRSLCYFSVWTRKELVTLQTKKDEEWKINLDILREFYIKYLYPEWCHDDSHQTTTVTILVN